MARMTYVDDNVETKTEKRIRYALVVLYFIQVLFAALPFMQGEIEGGYTYLTVLNLIVQSDGYNSFGEVMLLIYGALLVILPLTSFFFCILDKKTRVKYFISALSCVLCAVIITFGVGSTIAIGAVLTLFMNILCLFMTMQGLQATTTRMKNQK